MMKVQVCVALVVLGMSAVVLAEDPVYNGINYAERPFLFHGNYAAEHSVCGNDGFYYKDAHSFIICSNGHAYEQPCAPGSLNSGFEHFQHGNYYNYRDFCSVNLVDHGAGIPYNHHNHADGYHRDAPVYRP